MDQLQLPESAIVPVKNDEITHSELKENFKNIEIMSDAEKLNVFEKTSTNLIIYKNATRIIADKAIEYKIQNDELKKEIVRKSNINPKHIEEYSNLIFRACLPSDKNKILVSMFQ